MMDLNDFRASLDGDSPPADIPPLLRAMWLEAKGDWPGAHAIAQSEPNASGSWVHAYLHRVEGDLANAGYWYRRAGRPASQATLAEEWEEIVGALLG